MALTQSGSSPTNLTPNIPGIVVGNASPHIASATSNPPAPIASMPIAPAAGVWLSEPKRDFPGFPKRCMCTTWLTPLPGREYQIPKRRQALSRKQMIVGVQIVDLQEVVVDVLHADLGAHPIEANRLQRQHDEGAGGVLRERLVDLQGDRRAHTHSTIDEVR